jgi:glycyl-tRNA synthetase (class II)
MFITPESNILLVCNSTQMEIRVILGFNQAANPHTTEVLQNELTFVTAAVTEAEIYSVPELV